MHFWSFGKQKRKYITDNVIDIKFGPDVISSPANSKKIVLAQNVSLAEFKFKTNFPFCTLQ